MGDSVGVPALSQHRDRDDVTDALAKLTRLANSVHNLAQQVLIGDLFARAAIADVAEFLVERFARFQLLAIDQQRARASEPFPVSVVGVYQPNTAIADL